MKLNSGMGVRHVDGGQGTVVGFRNPGGPSQWAGEPPEEGAHDALVEWDDGTRTWEAATDLEVLQ